MLRKQYELIKSARAAVFIFLENNLPSQLSTPAPTFNNKSIANMLVHVVNTYISWTANFTLKMGKPFYDDQKSYDLEQIKLFYLEADLIMETFLNSYENEPDKLFSDYKSGNRFVEANILQLFTHVTTHEFHHKGQIMTMCRLLGQVPADTDIIRF